MASGRQFQSAIVFGKNKFKNVFTCIWHEKFELIASPRTTLGVLNEIFWTIYINVTMS